MKRTLFTTLLLAGFCLPPMSWANTIKPLNSIAAEANGNIITYGDIERAAKVLRQNGGQNASLEQLLTVAKQNLLERTLMVDAARTQGLQITPAEIDTEITRRANVSKVQPKDIYANAAHLGWSQEQYRLEVAKDLLIERLISGLQESIKITQDDIDKHIAQANKEGKTLPVGEPYPIYTVRRIVVQINKNNTVSSVGKRMALISQSLQQGHDFATLARRYSQEAAAAKGGVVELTDQSEPEKVEVFLHHLQKGQTSIPIQTAHNWQIIQMMDKRTESNPTKIQREAIRRQLLQEEQQKKQKQFMEQLQHDAVMREY